MGDLAIRVGDRITVNSYADMVLARRLGFDLMRQDSSADETVARVECPDGFDVDDAGPDATPVSGRGAPIRCAYVRMVQRNGVGVVLFIHCRVDGHELNLRPRGDWTLTLERQTRSR